MDIIEKAIPHIFRNKYLKNQGGTIIMGGSGGGFSSSSTGSGASELDDLTDVTVDYIANEDILQFDEVIGQWKNKPLEVDWGRVKNTPTTLEGYGITDAVHKSHLDDNVRHITQAERNKWNNASSNLEEHINDEVRHITAEEREDWNNPMIKKLKDVKLNDVKDNDILIYRETDNLWHNEQLPEYDWKKILSVNEDGEVVSKFDIIVEGECYIWDEAENRELTPISDADSYKLITSIGDELRISANLIIVRNISYDKSDSPIIDAEITDYIGITDNGDIIINSLRLVDKNLTVVDPAIQTEKNDYLKDALYFDSAGCLRCKVPFIGDDSISVTGGAHDTLFPGGGSVENIEIVDDLNTPDPNKALSANQGYILSKSIDSIIDKSGNLTNYYTKTEINKLLEDIETSGTDLSDYYQKSEVYNRTEVNQLIENNKPDLSNYYQKSEVYNRTETYTRDEIDSKIANIDTGGSSSGNPIFEYEIIYAKSPDWGAYGNEIHRFVEFNASKGCAHINFTIISSLETIATINASYTPTNGITAVITSASGNDNSLGKLGRELIDAEHSYLILDSITLKYKDAPGVVTLIVNQIYNCSVVLPENSYMYYHRNQGQSITHPFKSSQYYITSSKSGSVEIEDNVCLTGSHSF